MENIEAFKNALKASLPEGPVQDPFKIALHHLAPSEATIPDQYKKFLSYSIPELLDEIFPEYTTDEKEAILWGETGYPDFFDSRLGSTHFECLIRQVWNARARREQRYYNCIIREADEYAGVVNHLEFKSIGDCNLSRLRIDIDETTIIINDDATYEITIPDNTPIQGKATRSKPTYQPDTEWIEFVPDAQPFNSVINVMEVFEKYITDMGYEYKSDLPMDIFIKWVAAMATCSEMSEIDAETKQWIEDELKTLFGKK